MTNACAQRRSIGAAVSGRAAGILACLLLGACGGGDGEGTTDGSVADAGAADAPVSPDGDTEPDGGGGVDVDGDGVPMAVDCDDDDETVGRDSVRSCTSECDVGTQTCTDGVWSACDASSECACDTPGMMRTVDCGRCGIASQRCGEDGMWEMPSTCFDEKDCFAGTIERDTSMCGERARICDDTCHWRDWETVVEPGECEPGDTGTTADGCASGEMREQTCSDSCAWEVTGDCMVHCGRAPMTSRTGADPACIPAGPFVLGAEGNSNRLPIRTINLSEFYIDRIPVTKARFQMCIDAGSCASPSDSELYDPLEDDQWVIGIVESHMMAFCEWDGGYLVSEYQWEKAARGPAPDARLNSWGDDPGGCNEHPWMGCRDWPVAVAGAFPGAVSPYGVRLMGSLWEGTSTWYAAGYDAIADGATDPTGPSTGMYRTRRGFPWYLDYSYFTTASASARQIGGGTLVGFRCGY